MLDLLQKHTLVEADISAQAERIKAVQGAAQRFTSYEQGESTAHVDLVSFFVCIRSKCNVFLPFSNWQPTNRVSRD